MTPPDDAEEANGRYPEPPHGISRQQRFQMVRLIDEWENEGGDPRALADALICLVVSFKAYLA